MTEAEAKTKWCPMGRVENVTHNWHNKHDTDTSRTTIHTTYTPTCIGPNCMMWREHGPFSPDYKPRPDELGGFCGLAGRP